MKFAFIIDPIQKLDPCHDTSVALMEAAQELGHEVWVTQANLLSVVNGKAWAILERVKLTPIQLVDGHWVAAESWYSLGSSLQDSTQAKSFGNLQPLEEMDVVFMRTDPPVTTAYLYATYILDYIDPARTLVVNSPSGLRAANEKMYALQFTEAIPTTIVTQDKQVIRQFVEEQGAAVLKPLGGKAGEGILFLQPGDRNLNSMIEISTFQGQLPIMIQTYLPEAKAGDKRIILLDGEPIGAVNRVPTGNEFRGNMAVGGRVESVDITPREREICAQLAPVLRRDGLIFVGIDVIGGYLTEVNVTSPTGIREIDRLNQSRVGHQVVQWLEKAQASKLSFSSPA
ncbi:glutathione synthase [Trichocoleus sp. FACHB-591]|uniref:glutathione synthase n=1 Tax=Trichocoleus sp. FACHB-591 TaxID=2692872 RepID=UPI001686CE39|nr:glutathione synthase [Trichocoleus sp. FACHB-591]MBD2098448.1 glutathione synthase [Trichocoleus sp. FACHB-591]